MTDNLQRQIPAVVLQVKNRSNDVVSINSRCNKVRRKDYNSVTARTKPSLKMNMQKLRASDWLKTSLFSCNTSKKLQHACKFQRARACFQNVVCLDFSTGSCNFVVFEKFTRAYLHQTALEIMLLPILIVPFHIFFFFFLFFN